jgi:hypothetical protein
MQQPLPVLQGAKVTRILIIPDETLSPAERVYQMTDLSVQAGF